MVEISNRALLCFTVTVSTLSLIGVIFLVAVVATLVGKAIDLAKRIEKFQANVTDKINNMMKPDNFKNIRQASQDAWSRFDSKFIEPQIAGLAGTASRDVEERM
jgi:predicted PurR-regulated permease PerM